MVTDDIRQAFAARLNEALDDCGFPPKGEGRQGALGKRYGVSQHGARKWIEGEAMPELTRAVEMAIDLGVSVEWLLSGRGSKRAPAAQESGEPGARAESEAPPSIVAEPASVYVAVRKDPDLIRELLAGVLTPLGLRLSGFDIDESAGVSLQAGWVTPPAQHRRGLSAVQSPPPGELPPLPGEFTDVPPMARGRSRKAS